MRIVLKALLTFIIAFITLDTVGACLSLLVVASDIAVLGGFLGAIVAIVLGGYLIHALWQKEATQCIEKLSDYWQ